MSILSGKKILLGISGGIAAYKSAILVRLFIKSGAEVKVVMTPDAKEFITPLTLSTLSKNPVHSSFTSEDEDETWNNHVELGMWADLIIVCPATANTLSKMANGNCDNLLIAVYLSAKCPVYFAPAMDLDMYKHQSTKDSIAKLEKNGNILIPVESGELASGLVGEGRLAEPESIINFIEADIMKSLPLRGKKILVTAGPTYEAIDPVRYISNHSSGRMGYEIAKKAVELGAKVFLVSGPSNQEISNHSIDLLKVVTSKEIADSFSDGPEFFSTFGGSTLSCVIGKEVLEIIDDECLQENAQLMGEKLLNGLKKIQGNFSQIGDVRGMGLFLGVDLVKNSNTQEEDKDLCNYIKSRMRDYRILIGSEGPKDNILKIRPPLTIDSEGIDMILHYFEKIMKEV